MVPFGFFNVGFGDYRVFMRNGGHESNLNDAATGSIIPSIFHMRGLSIDLLRSKMQTNEAYHENDVRALECNRSVCKCPLSLELSVSLAWDGR